VSKKSLNPYSALNAADNAPAVRPVAAD
jgi:hypothetical protein